MLDLNVSNRVYLRPDTLSISLIGDLKAEFEHKNPVYYKMKSQGYWPTKAEPKVIQTWKLREDGSLSFPRGGLSRICKILSAYGETYNVHESCNSAKAEFPLPQIMPYEYQQRCIDAAIANRIGIVKAPTGCLTGDSMISVNRGGKGFKVRLDTLVAQFNGKAERYQWDLGIPTMVRSRFPDGRVQLVKLRDAYENGVQPVFELKTKSGKHITCTSSHRFMTTNGWMKLFELVVGDKIYVEMSSRPKKSSQRSRTWYRLKRVKFHPFCGRKGVNPKKGGFTVPLHRLVVESKMNGVSLQSYVERLNRGPAPEYVYLDPLIWAVHHKDGNSLNNALENLEVLTHAAHQQAHIANHLTNIAVVTELDEICSIEYQGDRPTFDLSVDAPNNYIANGIVVHNSGKTILGVALASQLDVPFMIVVNSAALLTQWEERIAQVFGEDYEVGRIQGRHFKLKPLTIAMAQTLHKLSSDRWADINKYFGGVIQDEVQVAAASTFMGSIDKCTAEYRIGLSADHTRKDRKEFLIHDTFGDVIEEISRDDLISRSFVLDVHVILTPTELDAEWYRQQRFANDLRLGGAEFEDIYLAMKKQWSDMKMEDVPKERPDFNRLLDTMCADPVRNAKLLGLATELVNDGRRIFVFSHRVDHCLTLIRDLGERGIRAGALIGGPENKEEFQRTIDGLQNGDYQVGVGTWQALGTGIDCSRVSGGIMATPINGKQIWGQIRGRLCRTHPGKKDAVLYYMWDRKVFFNAPVKNMKAWNTECSVDYNDTRMSAKEYLRMG